MAQNYYRKSLREYEALRERDSASYLNDIANVQMNLADTYQILGDYHSADTLFKKSLSFIKILYTKDSMKYTPIFANALNSMGKNYRLGV